MRGKQRPKLGQHFLVSPEHQKKILEALPLRGSDLVVEVGPGNGAMTEGLADRAGQVIAVELDKKLVSYLQKRFKGYGNVQIRQGDILNFDLADLCGEFQIQTCFVFGNLPYYISSAFLQRIFGFASFLSGMGLLLQREVAGRVAAVPGRRAYGFLSVMAQYYSCPKVLWRVPPVAFSPPPTVQSAFVEFVFPGRGGIRDTKEKEAFFRFLQVCFREKRKTLVNNLLPISGRKNIINLLIKLNIDPHIRAEQVSYQKFFLIFKLLKK